VGGLGVADEEQIHTELLTTQGARSRSSPRRAERHQRRAPAALALLRQPERHHQRVAFEHRVHGAAQRARALALGDAHLLDAARPALAAGGAPHPPPPRGGRGGRAAPARRGGGPRRPPPRPPSPFEKARTARRRGGAGGAPAPRSCRPVRAYYGRGGSPMRTAAAFVLTLTL